jgi:hypothetical protein
MAEQRQLVRAVIHLDDARCRDGQGAVWAVDGDVGHAIAEIVQTFAIFLRGRIDHDVGVVATLARKVTGQ